VVAAQERVLAEHFGQLRAPQATQALDVMEQMGDRRIEVEKELPTRSVPNMVKGIRHRGFQVVYSK
jgi:hypothetical protein